MMNINWQETTKKTIKIIAAIAICALSIKLFMTTHAAYEKFTEAKKNTICPSLLSISRSARDTLIVMKAESLCGNYVLENLK